MTECQKDPIGYYSFWPILAFSFFIASDQLLNSDNRIRDREVVPSLMACILVGRTFVHMFSINCLVLSILETYIAFVHVKNPLCSRILYLETNALFAGLFLIFVSVLEIVNELFEWTGEQLPHREAFLSQFVPWTISIVTLSYQCVRILTHHRVIRRSPPPPSARRRQWEAPPPSHNTGGGARRGVRSHRW
jgi:hypothetical protein